MSSKLLTWAAEQRTGRPARKAVLREIADQASDATNLATVSFADIARRTEMSYRNVQRCVEELETVCKLVRRERLRDEHGYLAGFQFSFPTAPKSLPDKTDALPDNLAATAAALPDNMSGQDLEVQELDQDLKPSSRPKPSEVTPNGVPSSGDKKPRDTIWDICEELFGPTAPKTNAHGKRNKAVKDLKLHDADADSVRLAASRWDAFFGGTPMTDTALSTHYPHLLCATPPKPRSNGRSLGQVVKDVRAKLSPEELAYDPAAEKEKTR